MKTIYSHGKGFDSCVFCDKELMEDEPGKRVMYMINSEVRFIEFTCMECFNGKDYQKSINDFTKNKEINITQYPK